MILTVLINFIPRFSQLEASSVILCEWSCQQPWEIKLKARAGVDGVECHHLFCRDWVSPSPLALLYIKYSAGQSVGKFQDSTDVKSPSFHGVMFSQSPYSNHYRNSFYGHSACKKKYYLKVLNFLTNPQRLRQDEWVSGQNRIHKETLTPKNLFFFSFKSKSS